MELFGAQKPLLQRSRLQYKAQCLLCLIPKPCSCWDDLPALPCQLNGSDQTASSHYRRAYIILGAKLVIHVFGYHSVQGAAGQRMIISVDLADRRPPSELSRCSGRESHLMCDVAEKHAAVFCRPPRLQFRVLARLLIKSSVRIFSIVYKLAILAGR